MTTEEKREWIRILFEKVLIIHEKGKHYASVDINNVNGSTLIGVTAMKNEWEATKEYDFYAPCITDPEEITRAVEFLDGLIKDGEAVK